MPVNSRQKGKRIERAAAAYLCKLGFDARRGQQYRGGEDSPDVLCLSLPNIHFEVKGDEKIDIHTKALEEAYGQAFDEAAGQRTPVVLWKRKRRPWCLSFPVGDYGILVTTTGDGRIRRMLMETNASG